MRAVTVDENHRLILAETPDPQPQRSEAIVKVAAISLNRGEVNRSMSAAKGFRPGWDLAGVVEKAASDRSGPAAGTRVVGILPSGAWAETVAVPTNMLAPLPDSVSFEQASCLPVAGLTALYALAYRSDLLGAKVLVTGASGGVGHFACRLAQLSGAHVVAAVRSQAQADLVKGYGADEVAIVGEEPDKAASSGPYDLILESVGGASLAASLKMLAPGGVCVVFGVSGGAQVTFDAGTFFRGGGCAMQGFMLFGEFARKPASAGLGRLVSLVAAGKLKPDITVTESWTEVDRVARDLLARRYPGKAVLRI